VPEFAETPISRYLSILPQTPEEKVLRLLIEVGREIVGAQEGSLPVFDESRQDLVFAMTAGNADSEISLAGQRVPLGSGVTGLAALTHEVQAGAPTFDDIQQSERLNRGGPVQPSVVLAAPMLVNDVLVGVLTAISFEPGKHFSSRDLRFYASFAAIAGLVVQQRRTLALREIDSGLSLNASSESHKAEQTILATLHRLLDRGPESVVLIANILTSIERLIGPRS
jgi:GAF domain-containing protein